MNAHIPTATLTDRYIEAAMRTVPDTQRADLSAELRASIDDQIDARIESGQPQEDAERAVLTELGDPDALAAGYTDRPLQLIGPRYFLDWWRLLKLLLWIVPACAAFGVALAQTIAGAPVGEIIGSTVTVVISVIVHVGFWTTLVFAIIERSGQRPGGPLAPWSLDSLPEPRQSGASLSEMLWSLALLAIAAGAVLWDHFIGLAFGFPGLSFLDAGLWPWWIAGLLLVLALGAVLSISVYAARGWTVALAAEGGILNLVFTIPALWLLVNGELINPEFFPTIVGAEGAEVTAIVTVVLAFVIAGIAVWGTFDAVIKATRGRSARAQLRAQRRRRR